MEFSRLANDMELDENRIAAVGSGFRGRGLFASRAVGLFGSETLLSAPHQLCVALGSGDSSSRGVGAAYAAARLEEELSEAPAPLLHFASDLSVDAHARLAVLLHYIACSKWAEYGALLPRWDELANAPALEEEELAAFQDGAFAAVALAAMREAKALAAEVQAYPGLREAGVAPADVREFRLAFARVRSRTFAGHVGVGEKLGLIVPFADLCNHAFNPNSDFDFDAYSGSFTIRSRRGISAGDEVCISYGEDMDNRDLQLTYGFVVPGNENDRVVLPGTPPGSLPRAALAGAARNDRDALRASAAAASLRGVGGDASSRLPETPLAAAWAAEAAARALASAPTSAEEDEAQLSSARGHAEAAIRYRLERKRLLEAVARIAAEAAHA